MVVNLFNIELEVAPFISLQVHKGLVFVSSNDHPLDRIRSQFMILLFLLSTDIAYKSKIVVDIKPSSVKIEFSI